ncbi:hypothetical protein [Pseudomonas jinjuensis]|uniref:Uncharacterized protein n=1 Tax=Pseudomonas jinjuensis TaxID=198616 RepID=A0A1H0NMP4_9PSED|nr:hypothetical protein [Pseudomonas jinjuensis]SDO93620.1 hypothetical protein SAMN05216193_11885 [Pseudomonas jinjuensis]
MQKIAPLLILVVLLAAILGGHFALEAHEKARLDAQRPSPAAVSGLRVP